MTAGQYVWSLDPNNDDLQIALGIWKAFFKPAQAAKTDGFVVLCILSRRKLAA